MAVRPSGVRPEFTCPYIDVAIKKLESASRDAERAAKSSEDNFAATALREVASSCDSAIDDFENLRRSNSTLRDSAEEWESYARVLEGELAAAEERAEKAEEELAGEF